MVYSETEASKHYTFFIDALYAIVVALSIAVGLAIFAYGTELFSLSIDTLASLSIYALAVVVIFLSIISSFIFWSNTISVYPYKNPKHFFVDTLTIAVHLGIMLNLIITDRMFFVSYSCTFYTSFGIFSREENMVKKLQGWQFP